MIQLLDFSRTKTSMLTNVKDYHIVETLDGNETLYFSLPIEDSQNDSIKLEYYAQNDTNRYVIKEKHSSGDWYDYVCQLDLDDFKRYGNPSNFNFTGYPTNFLSYITTSISTADKTWTYTSSAAYNSVTISIGSYNDYVYLLSEGAKAYNAEFKIDVINRVINFTAKMGSDKGCYFIESLNLKKLEIDSDTNSIVTALYPVGKDGLTISSVNSGTTLLKNNTYCDKQIYAVWKDERYTNAAQLKADAEAKLAELCQPATTYSVDVIDLASANPDYNIFAYSIGDTVTLFNNKENQKQTHRIVEIDRYPEEPHRNKCQMSSRAYSIIGVQKQSFKTTDSIQGKVGIAKTNGDGTISTASPTSDYTPASADYIVSQGTSGIWTYRKWNSGIAECWGTYQFKPSSVSPVSTAERIKIYMANTGYINLPFTFITANMIEASMKVWVFANIVQSATQASTNVASVRALLYQIDNDGVPTNGYGINFNVKGTWK